MSEQYADVAAGTAAVEIVVAVEDVQFDLYSCSDCNYLAVLVNFLC